MKRSLAIISAAFAIAPIHAQPTAAPPRPDKLAPGPLSPLNFFIGDWTIDATWSWGATLKGRNEYRVSVNGQFLEVKTIVQDNDGPVYERYLSYYTYDKANEAFVAVGFAADGSTSSMEHTLQVEDGFPRMDFDTTNPDGSKLRQSFQAIDPNTVSWKAWMSAPGASQESQIMDGQWRRVMPQDPYASADAAPMTGPYTIDPAKFDARGAEVRSFTKTAIIDAPRADVYNAWSTPEGWHKVYGSADSAAIIDLAIGGRYEWLFNAQTGSNGCQVLSYIPDRMISFTWNAPPEQPDSRKRRTWVVVELADTDEGKTQVTLTHLGFGSAAHWNETHDYFQSAWDRVLGAMQSALTTNE